MTRNTRLFRTWRSAFLGVNRLSKFCDLAKMLLDFPEQKF
jgi:hypothetical protein